MGSVWAFRIPRRPVPVELEIMDMGEIRRTCVFLTEKVDVISIRAMMEL